MLQRRQLRSRHMTILQNGSPQRCCQVSGECRRPQVMALLCRSNERYRCGCSELHEGFNPTPASLFPFEAEVERTSCKILLVARQAEPSISDVVEHQGGRQACSGRGVQERAEGAQEAEEEAEEGLQPRLSSPHTPKHAESLVLTHARASDRTKRPANASTSSHTSSRVRAVPLSELCERAVPLSWHDMDCAVASVRHGGLPSCRRAVG